MMDKLRHERPSVSKETRNVYEFEDSFETQSETQFYSNLFKILHYINKDGTNHRIEM